MTVTVDPAQLDGYADQLERNAEYFLTPLRSYCDANCAHTAGMTGLLATAKPVVDLAGDASGRLFASGERNLLQVAANLRLAAREYRDRDDAAAERLWEVLPRVHAPQGYAEKDDERHGGDFRDPFIPQLAVAPKPDSLHRMIDEARQHVGLIDEYLSRHFDWSLAGNLLPLITGDWDTLRANAHGYRALGGRLGAAVIGDNLRYGLDSLSASWDSPAATQFDYLIRERWLPAIDALRHVLAMNEEMLETIAQQAQYTFETLVVTLEVLKHWVIEKTLRIVRLVAAAVPGGHLLTEIGEFVKHVYTVWHEIKMLLRLLTLAIGGVVQDAQTLAAEVAVATDLWRIDGENRLAPIMVG
jgi:uncharacterized protein YukE